MDWVRKTLLCNNENLIRKEIWEYKDDDKKSGRFEVDVFIGKQLNVLNLKNLSLKDINDYAIFLKKTAEKVYGSDELKNEIDKCPCCEAAVCDKNHEFEVLEVVYTCCWQCGHVFVKFQPSQEKLLNLFSESEEHSFVYTDRKNINVRLNEVVKPKLDWLKKIYKNNINSEVKSILDVGAGGGHFVEVCRSSGITAEGYEISNHSRRFAKQVFNIDLLNENFLNKKSNHSTFDVITFWGLLEYVPEPKKFIELAHSYLKKDRGMLVIEVPRFDCISSSAQKIKGSKISRHLDPTSHVNCFTDASLATLLYKCRFKPVAVWYFGMDAYELFVQIALKLNDDKIIEEIASFIPQIQASLDSAYLCDDIIVAAVPF